MAAALLLVLNLGVWWYALRASSLAREVDVRLARYAGKPGALAEVRRFRGSPLARLVGLVAGRLKRRSAARRRQYTVQEMQAAGVDPARLDAMRYVLGTTLGVGAAAAGALLLGAGAAPGVALVGFGVGYVLPGVRATGVLESRRRQIFRQLPDTLDLVVVAMNAGLSFDHAVGSMVASQEGPLAHLFRMYLDEVSFGRPAPEALAALAERSGVPEVRQVVAHVVQSRRYGASLVDVLRSQSDYLRRILRTQQREKAGRASVQMLFPLILCIFPVTFLVTVAPIAIRLLTSGVLTQISR